MVIDTPKGVQIAHSAEPDQIGQYFRKLDGISIENVATLAPLLDQMAKAGAPNGFSTTIESPYNPADPLEKDPQLAGSTTSLAGRLPPGERPYFQSLANAVAATPPITVEDARYEAEWGVLARVAGRTFLRQGATLGVTCNKLLSTDCLVFFRWEQPGALLARDWFNEVGLVIASDLIVPSAKPGAFIVHRRTPAGDYVRHSVILASRERFEEDGQTLRLVVAPFYNPPLGHEKNSYELRRENLTTAMLAIDRAKAVQQGVIGMAQLRQRLVQAEKNRRDQARSEAMAGLYNALNTVGQAIEQGSRQQQVDFDNRMALQQAGQEAERLRMEANRATAAQEAERRNLGSNRLVTVPVPSGTAPAAAPASRTVRMVLIAGILPTDADQKGPNGFGRNPNCQSNIITATIRDDRGSNVPVEELFNQYRANFLAKCQRLGTVSTGPTYEIEYPHSTRFGQTGWNDRLVTLP